MSHMCFTCTTIWFSLFLCEFKFIVLGLTCRPPTNGLSIGNVPLVLMIFLLMIPFLQFCFWIPWRSPSYQLFWMLSWLALPLIRTLLIRRLPECYLQGTYLWVWKFPGMKTSLSIRWCTRPSFRRVSSMAWKSVLDLLMRLSSCVAGFQKAADAINIACINRVWTNADKS